jgi:23S rRNA pseudouridine2605 synthase
MPEPIRLQRYLSQAGVAARRKAEELIVAGRVTVNGTVVRELGTKVDPDKDHVQVDGEGIAAEDKLYILLNKPKGCITAVRDDRGRPTVMDYLPNLPASVAPVGRLDFYSEGVLLLTNDGELASLLLSPASHVPKTYHVKVRGELRPKALQALRDGVRLEDGTVTRPAEVEELPGESKHTWLGITLHEGKSRQIHRMLEALGHQVAKLQRVAFANLTFHDLRVGDARELSQLELNELRDQVGLDHRAVARGRWRSNREQTDIARRARGKAAAEKAEATAVAPPVAAPVVEPGETPRPQSPRSRGAVLLPKHKPRPKPRPTESGRPSSGRPSSGRPSSGRPSSGRPSSGRPSSGRPSSGRPSSGRPSSGRPSSGKKSGPRGGSRGSR